jgi:hypothetical protein
MFLLQAPARAETSARRDWFTSFGDNMQYILGVYALGMTVYHQDFEGMEEFTEAMVASQLTTAFLKKVVNERRPNYDFGEGGRAESFPSGHASAAFSSASFIHSRYGFANAAIPYVMASAVGYSRVRARLHYTHDVLAGAGIAMFYSWLLVSKYEGVAVYPIPGGAAILYKKEF